MVSEENRVGDGWVRWVVVVLVARDHASIYLRLKLLSTVCAARKHKCTCLCVNHKYRALSVAATLSHAPISNCRVCAHVMTVRLPRPLPLAFRVCFSQP